MGFAVAVAAALGIYALTIGDSIASNVPRCRSPQLSDTVDGPIGSEPGPTVWVTLTNSSQTTCSLPSGAPKVWVTWQRVHLRFHKAARISFPLGPRPACLSKGSPSTILVSSPLVAA